ncbi:MAG TPA: DUF2169 domain-containing protein, partial [Nannocystis sp.]
MPQLDNRTAFGASLDLSLDRDGRTCLVVVVAGSFELPAAGRPAPGPLRPSDLQPPPLLHDEYYGDPATSSLRREGQSTHLRPGTDIHLLGQAWAPRGRPTTRAFVHLSLGPCVQEAVITGPRRYLRGVADLRPSAPEPFERVPLRYEHCAGGPVEPRNPVAFAGARDALDRPLPQIEDPRHPLTSWRDRPPPAGFGPIARSWLPRRAYAGT